MLPHPILLRWKVAFVLFASQGSFGCASDITKSSNRFLSGQWGGPGAEVSAGQETLTLKLYCGILEFEPVASPATDTEWVTEGRVAIHSWSPLIGRLVQARGVVKGDSLMISAVLSVGENEWAPYGEDWGFRLKEGAPPDYSGMGGCIV